MSGDSWTPGRDTDSFSASLLALVMRGTVLFSFRIFLLSCVTMKQFSMIVNYVVPFSSVSMEVGL